MKEVSDGMPNFSQKKDITLQFVHSKYRMSTVGVDKLGEIFINKFTVKIHSLFKILLF